MDVQMSPIPDTNTERESEKWSERWREEIAETGDKSQERQSREERHC
jgi:hypothetical protein